MGRKPIYLEHEGISYTVEELCSKLKVNKYTVRNLMTIHGVGYLESISIVLGRIKKRKENKDKIKLIVLPEIIEEDEVCSEFGCPTILSITEKLCGDKCLKHQ